MSLETVTPASTSPSAVSALDTETERHVLVVAAAQERPRLYVMSVLNALNYDPVTGVAHLTTPWMTSRMKRSEEQCNEYKKRNRTGSRLWDEVRFDNTGNYSRLTPGWQDRLHGDMDTIRTAVQGCRVLGNKPLLGTVTASEQRGLFGVDGMDVWEYEDLSPAERMVKSGMPTGPVGQLFNADLTHRSPKAAYLAATFHAAVRPDGTGKVRREQVRRELGTMYVSAADRCVKTWNDRAELYDLKLSGDNYEFEVSPLQAALRESWWVQQPGCFAKR